MPDFKSLFESAPDLYLVLSPTFEIVAVSDAYLRATMTQRTDILGRGLFDVFPDNPDDPAATGASNLRHSLAQVLEHRVVNTMAVQKYDIRSEDGTFEEHFWSPVNTPVLDEAGAVRWIIHRVEDVTDFVRLKDKQQTLQTRAERMEKEVYRRAQEVQKANQELADANIRLGAASRMKSEFLATMSHELRTPLNAIIGFSEVLKLQHPGPLNERQLDFLGDIYNSGQHLLSLINDILDLSKIEAGKMALDLESLDLHTLMHNSLTVIKERAAGADISVALEFEEMPGEVSVDRRKVTQIVYNLLSNAVKFTPRGGHIALRIKIAPLAAIQNWHSDAPASVRMPLPASYFKDFIEISVEDNGCGIAPEDVPRLFKPFSQLDSSLSRASEGTGLGLALVFNLANLHQGTAAMASTPGKGSCFTVWLPLRN